MKLHDILDIVELNNAISDGLVRQRQHPDDPRLLIFNYTEKTQYEKAWSHVTRTCRGLIVDWNDGTVLARPWPKFFNVGEHDDLDMAARVQVTDKLDGSLGILYTAPDGRPAIATRGSFESEQALHATALYRERYEGRWEPLPGHTYLFEIVYPANRIVLDYSGLDDLVLLGVVDTDTGHPYGPGHALVWPGRRAETFDSTTLADALAIPPRPNAEGLVVRYVDTGQMVKIKQDDYVRLHKIVTGLSERGVWEHLAGGGTIEQLAETVPDEFHGWLRHVGGTLLELYGEHVTSALAEYDRTIRHLPVGWTRKDFALAVADLPSKGLLFQMLDGRDITPAVWKFIRPVGHHPMRPTSEDAA